MWKPCTRQGNVQQPLHKARVHNGSRPNGTDVTSFGAPPQWFQKIDLSIRNIPFNSRSWTENCFSFNSYLWVRQVIWEHQGPRLAPIRRSRVHGGLESLDFWAEIDFLIVSCLFKFEDEIRSNSYRYMHPWEYDGYEVVQRLVSNRCAQCNAHLNTLTFWMFFHNVYK